jgi:hypothetical protein
MKKKFFAITLIFISSFALLAWEMPSRYFELGFDYEFGAANRSLSWGDVFNSDKTIEVDLDKLAEDEFGLDFATRGAFFLNFQSKGKYKIGFGVFSDFEGGAFGSLSQEAVELLVKGNGDASAIEGSAAAGGSLFAGVGLRATATIRKWKFTLTPAVFIPLFYMEEPDVRYSLTNGDPFSGSITVKADLYTALLPEDDIVMDDLIAPKGFDLSLDVSYPLFTFLELGGTLTHIPVLPAHMTTGRRINKDYQVNGSGKPLKDIVEDGDWDSLLDPEPSEDDLVSFTGDDQEVKRPLRFDVYAVYRPFRNWMRLSLKPSVGLSLFTVYNTTHFNVGLETEFKLINMFGLTWDFRYREDVWLNKLGLMLNFRVLELDLGLGFRSQDLPGAFTAKGLYGSVGFRLGF